MISGQDARTTRNFWGFYFLEVPKQKTIMPQMKILQEDQSYTFSSYFDLPKDIF